MIRTSSKTPRTSHAGRKHILPVYSKSGKKKCRRLLAASHLPIYPFVHLTPSKYTTRIKKERKHGRLCDCKTDLDLPCQSEVIELNPRTRAQDHCKHSAYSVVPRCERRRRVDGEHGLLDNKQGSHRCALYRRWNVVAVQSSATRTNEHDKGSGGRKWRGNSMHVSLLVHNLHTHWKSTTQQQRSVCA